jgi:hypothetical protein
MSTPHDEFDAIEPKLTDDGHGSGIGYEINDGDALLALYNIDTTKADTPRPVRDQAA